MGKAENDAADQDEGAISHFEALEFIDGQYACSIGEPHSDEWSESKTRGYNAQYQHEQNMEALSEFKGSI